MKFNSIQESIIKNTGTLKTIGYFLGLFGVAGMLNGAYSYLQLSKSPDTQMLNGIMVLYSFGTIVLSYFLHQCSEIIEKLAKGKSF